MAVRSYNGNYWSAPARAAGKLFASARAPSRRGTETFRFVFSPSPNSTLMVIAVGDKGQYLVRVGPGGELLADVKVRSWGEVGKREGARERLTGIG